MNEKQKERFHEFVGQWLKDYFDDHSWLPDSSNVVKVTDVEEVQKSSGFCNTCYYVWTALVITYEDAEGNSYTYDYQG